jgi:hypothetical protein
MSILSGLSDEIPGLSWCPYRFTPEANMFIVKGRLLGTVLGLVVAALGATLLAGSPSGGEATARCADPPPAAVAALAR